MTRAHRAAHRYMWLMLAVLLPLTVLGALVSRPSGPTEAPQLQLAPPK